MPDFAVNEGDSLRSVEQGADTILWLLVAEEAAGLYGKFLFDRQVVRIHMPWSWTEETTEERNELWRTCEDMFKTTDKVEHK